MIVLVCTCLHEAYRYQQLLKQVAEYKLQLSSLKEQETDMRTQVGHKAVTGISGLFYFTFRGRFLHVFFLTSTQLDMYSKKFDEFQGTVSKSSSVYSGFKQDMDKVRMAF